MRFLDREAGGARVSDLLEAHVLETATVILSAIQWGEVVKNLTKRAGAHTVAGIEQDFANIGVEIVPADAERAKRSALLGLKYKVSYADAFGLELASDSPDHVLVTADYGVKPAERDIKIEFLPTKPKP
jgi:predicted nucleic acid-binding protein